MKQQIHYQVAIFFSYLHSLVKILHGAIDNIMESKQVATYSTWSRQEHEHPASPGTFPSPTEPCIWACSHLIWLGGHQDVLPWEFTLTALLQPKDDHFHMGALCMSLVKLQTNYTPKVPEQYSNNNIYI